MATSPEPKPIEPAKTPKSRNAQDKKMENDLIAINQTLRASVADAEAGPQLAEGGYSVTELNRVLTDLYPPAYNGFVNRQDADANQAGASAAYKAAEKSTRTFYRKLRGFAKSAFLKDPQGRVALGLEGREPVDFQNFIAAANRLVDEGLKSTYAEKLARKTVTAAKLQDLRARLDTLLATKQAQTDAIEAAPRATAVRDAAVKALFDWYAEFKAFALVQFQDRPDILKRLGLK